MRHTTEKDLDNSNGNSWSKGSGSRLWRHFPFTYLCLALILVLSFFTPPKTPLDQVAFIDKWTHLAMYGGTVGVFMVECWWMSRRTGLRLSGRSLVVCGLLCPVVLGGLIELAQAYCTGGRRSGDWLDWLADAIGVVLAYVIGRYVLLRSLRA